MASTDVRFTGLAVGFVPPAPSREEGDVMRLRLRRRLVERPAAPRPAKVVSLEVRRQARLEATALQQLPPSRPAA